MSARGPGGAAAAALCLACAIAPPPEPGPGPGGSGRPAVSGVVFHDRDGDGRRGPGEPGIAGVAVSNGHEVTRSDAAGRYALPLPGLPRDGSAPMGAAGSGFVFVVKPRGWLPPRDPNGLPRFFRAHRPEGSPGDLRYPGIPPTGPLPDSVDFPLRPRPEGERFRALVLGDPQPRSLAEVDWLARDVVAELVGFDAAFGISLGDLVHDDLSLFEPLNRALGRIGVPWWSVLGNHDLNTAAADDAGSAETFGRVYGPATYAFQVGRVHFLVLDDVVYEGAREDGTPGGYHADLAPDDLAFVGNYLALVPPRDLVVLAMHIPLGRWPDATRRALFARLAGHPHTFSLSAHTHLQQHHFYGAEDGFPGERPHHHLNVTTASGGWWLGAEDEVGIPHATSRCGAPNGYWVLRFDGAAHAGSFRAARRPAGYQLKIHAPAAVAAVQAAATEVVVNVFAGSERSRVEMRLVADGGAEAAGSWRPLRHEPRVDPFYLEIGARETRWLPLERRLTPPALSPHIWVGRLPADPPPGTAVIEVRTTDLFGQTFSGRRLIRIE